MGCAVRGACVREKQKDGRRGRLTPPSAFHFLTGPDRPPASALRLTRTKTKKQKERKKATAVSSGLAVMEDFSSPGFFDSYYGAEADVEKGESFQDILPQVDWLFEDAPSYPMPVPVGLPGEPKEEEGKNKEVVFFPGFPALKHQQHQTVSED